MFGSHSQNFYPPSNDGSEPQPPGILSPHLSPYQPNMVYSLFQGLLPKSMSPVVSSHLQLRAAPAGAPGCPKAQAFETSCRPGARVPFTCTSCGENRHGAGRDVVQGIRSSRTSAPDWHAGPVPRLGSTLVLCIFYLHWVQITWELRRQVT